MKVLKGFNLVATRIIALAMLAALLTSVYVLWSNSRTYRDAEDVYDELLLLKPNNDDPDNSGDLTLAFEELKKINPDICAWLTVNGTKIDYPVVRGENNMFYMNKDVYKENSLAGSIFLDSRNSMDFSDPYELIYGHHMDRGLMFGDLDLYKDEEFFNNNQTAVITTEQGDLEYRVIAAMDIIDSTDEIFDPYYYGSDLSGLHAFLGEHSLYLNESAMEEFAENPTQSQIIALVTCTVGQTGTRWVVFLYRHLDTVPTPPDPHSDDPVNPPDYPVNPSNPQTGNSIMNSPRLWTVLFVLFGLILSVTFWMIRKYNKTRK